MADSHDFRYLAGFFDGEGHVSIVDTTGRGHCRIGVEVVQVDPRPLVLFQEAFGGRITRRVHDGNPKHRVQHRWMAFSHEAADCLRSMLPFLIVKADIAQIAIRLYDRMQTQIGNASEADVAVERRVRAALVSEAHAASRPTFDDFPIPSVGQRSRRQYSSARLVPRVRNPTKLAAARQMRSAGANYGDIALSLGSKPSAIRGLLKYHEGDV